MPKLRFLGTGDSQGVPRWWCTCNICKEARASKKNMRTRPSVLIEGKQRTLIDVAPELRLQMTREDIKDIDTVLITHAHNDHILGLGDVADRARWTQKTTPVFTPAEIVPQLQERFPYFQRGNYPGLLPVQALTDKRTIETYKVTHFKVPHGANGFAYAFRFANPGASWVYMPDSLGVKDIDFLKNLDLLILGTSFYKEDAPYERRSVYDITEALELLKVIKPRQTLFTHLGHGVDVRKALPEGVNASYAFDGLQIDLPL